LSIPKLSFNSIETKAETKYTLIKKKKDLEKGQKSTRREKRELSYLDLYKKNSKRKEEVEDKKLVPNHSLHSMNSNNSGHSKEN